MTKKLIAVFLTATLFAGAAFAQTVESFTAELEGILRKVGNK